MSDLSDFMNERCVTVTEFSRALDRIDALEAARSLADDPQAVEIRWCMTHRCSVSGNNIACWQFHYDWKGKGVDPSESGCAIRVLRAAEGEDG